MTGGAGGVSLRAAGEQHAHVADHSSSIVPRTNPLIIYYISRQNLRWVVVVYASEQFIFISQKVDVDDFCLDSNEFSSESSCHKGQVQTFSILLLNMNSRWVNGWVVLLFYSKMKRVKR